MIRENPKKAKNIALVCCSIQEIGKGLNSVVKVNPVVSKTLYILHFWDRQWKNGLRFKKSWMNQIIELSFHVWTEDFCFVVFVSIWKRAWLPYLPNSLWIQCGRSLEAEPLQLKHVFMLNFVSLLSPTTAFVFVFQVCVAQYVFHMVLLSW